MLNEGYNSATITSSCGSTWVWNNNIATKLAANPPDIVLILLGTNDVNSNSWNPTQCSPTAVRNSMSAFLDQIWAYNPNIKIVLGSPPPASGATLNTVVSQYTALIPALVSEKVSQGRKITFANHNAAMNNVAGGDLVGDGIHPSPAGYQKMAQVWYDALVALQSPTTQYSLSVTKSGFGAGTVTSSPLGINCGSTCTSNFNSLKQKIY